jgi:hypothetical protein
MFAAARAVLLENDASAAFDQCTFHNNRAYWGYGGAFEASDNVKLAITRGTFRKQIAT